MQRAKITFYQHQAHEPALELEVKYVNFDLPRLVLSYLTHKSKQLNADSYSVEIWEEPQVLDLAQWDKDGRP